MSDLFTKNLDGTTFKKHASVFNGLDERFNCIEEKE